MLALAAGSLSREQFARWIEEHVDERHRPT